MASEAPTNGCSDNNVEVTNLFNGDGLPGNSDNDQSNTSRTDSAEYGIDCLSSDNNGDEDKLYEVKREPYFAFVPKIFNWGAGIVAGEAKNVTNAVTGFPSWSQQYGKDTYNFYRTNPRILYDEIISGYVRGEVSFCRLCSYLIISRSLPSGF